MHARTFPVTGNQDSKAGMGTRLRFDDSGFESLLQKMLIQPPFYWVQGFFPGGKAAGVRS
jgi:hypothetical protein